MLLLRSTSTSAHKCWTRRHASSRAAGPARVAAPIWSASPDTTQLHQQQRRECRHPAGHLACKSKQNKQLMHRQAGKKRSLPSDSARASSTHTRRCLQPSDATLCCIRQAPACPHELSLGIKCIIQAAKHRVECPGVACRCFLDTESSRSGRLVGRHKYQRPKPQCNNGTVEARRKISHAKQHQQGSMQTTTVRPERDIVDVTTSPFRAADKAEVQSDSQHTPAARCIHASTWQGEARCCRLLIMSASHAAGILTQNSNSASASDRKQSHSWLTPMTPDTCCSGCGAGGGSREACHTASRTTHHQQLQQLQASHT
ncbi:hypothetical protein COO60DRAFT_1547488 [Scenedesmus sp. NREL 46B-D3]|nr:hypothetical protein COO60DRAFT_1547488 [Scenedesmus sp. NREL 46B-D3]